MCSFEHILLVKFYEKMCVVLCQLEFDHALGSHLLASLHINEIHARS